MRSCDTVALKHLNLLNYRKDDFFITSYSHMRIKNNSRALIPAQGDSVDVGTRQGCRPWLWQCVYFWHHDKVSWRPPPLAGSSFSSSEAGLIQDVEMESVQWRSRNTGRSGRRPVYVTGSLAIKGMLLSYSLWTASPQGMNLLCPLKQTPLALKITGSNRFLSAPLLSKRK